MAALRRQLANTAATLFFSLVLLKPSAWCDIICMKRENLPWFLPGRSGRRLPGFRLRLACCSGADGGDAEPPALSGLPAVPVAIDQPRLRGDEHRCPHRCPSPRCWV